MYSARAYHRNEHGDKYLFVKVLHPKDFNPAIVMKLDKDLYCMFLFSSPCAKHNYCFLLTEHLSNRTFWLRISCIVFECQIEQKIVHGRGSGPSNINLDIFFLFAPLMFARLHNHCSLLTLT